MTDTVTIDPRLYDAIAARVAPAILDAMSDDFVGRQRRHALEVGGRTTGPRPCFTSVDPGVRRST